MELETFDSVGLGPLYALCLPIFDAPSFIDRERIEELDAIEDTDFAEEVERLDEGVARMNINYGKQILNYVELTRYRAFN